MVPSSVTNRKTDAADVGALARVTPLTLKPPVAPPSPLNTVPVGVPSAPSGLPGIGMLTTSGLIEGAGLPEPGTLYSVDRPVPLSETQTGLVGASEMPQGLTRWMSCNWATPGR